MLYEEPEALFEALKNGSFKLNPPPEELSAISFVRILKIDLDVRSRECRMIAEDPNGRVIELVCQVQSTDPIRARSKLPNR